MNQAKLLKKEYSYSINNNAYNECFAHETKLINKSSNHINSEIIKYLTQHFKLSLKGTLVMHANIFEKQTHKERKVFKTIINLGGFNKVVSIDDFFEKANARLSESGKFICIFEKQRGKVRKLSKVKVPFIEPIIGFIMKISELKFVSYVDGGKPQYFNYRKVSKAEVLGRLYASGFRLVAEKKMSGKWFFVAEKVNSPLYPDNPTQGVFAKLNRIGRNGKFIKVYKFRTMHPYSEFIQHYVYSTNGSSNGDKAVNDFRITRFGKFMRKYWIDEIPMIINFLKGDIKLVGVRPLSKAKFDTYPVWLQQKRIKFKPGLLPPFYSDMPNSFEEIIASENKYLEEYEKSPLKTDLKYFLKIAYNILIKKARSC